MGRVMFFLLRIAFWLGVVCVLLPSGRPKNDEQIDAAQAITVASAAVSDARGFCDRQPRACVEGGAVATAIGHKAEAGARTLYQFISAKLTDKPVAADPEVAAKSAEKPAVVPVSARGHGTLTGADLQPAYHAPVPLPPRRDMKRRPAV